MTRSLVPLAVGLLSACLMRAPSPRLSFITLEGSVRSGGMPAEGVSIDLFDYPGDMERVFIAGTVTDARGQFTLRVATPPAATCHRLYLIATALGRYESGETGSGEITCTDRCQRFDWDLPRKHVVADEIRPAERSLCGLK